MPSMKSTGIVLGVYTASTINSSIYGYNTLDTLGTPSIADVCTPGTACHSVLVQQ